MSRKITRYCSLKDRKGKQVYAYFKQGKKSAKVLCDVVTEGCDLSLKPVNADERTKMDKCIGYHAFHVHPDWPNTEQWHNRLLKSCSAVGHSIHRKPKKVEKKLLKFSTDGQDYIINVGEKYTCSFYMNGVEYEGPWKVVLDKNDRGRAGNSYYLLSNNEDRDGGHDEIAKKHKFKYGYWICDEGDKPEYNFKPSTDVSMDSTGVKFCDFEVEKTHEEPIRITGVTHDKHIAGKWMLHRSAEGNWYLLSNDSRADGGRPTKEKDMLGFSYSWYIGDSLTNCAYKLVEVCDKCDECSVEDPLVRIANALDRIASYLAK